jgi:hypothetical protein
MKTTLFTFLLLAFALTAGAQNPVIEGDLLLCPDTNGTASVTNDTEYDTYQWYSKFWFTDDEFVAIDGATSSSFTYDWYTYDQSLFKVVVTLNGETFESNQIQIDSWAWAGLVVMNETEGNVVFDPDNGFLICNGASIINTIQMPYSVVQWYKDGQAIDGATSVNFTITEPGTYLAVAAPEFCPNSTSTTLPIVVAMNPDCGSNEPTPVVISGDILLCPDTNGTANITNNFTYDSYQWYYKYWFTDDGFTAIDGATSSTFTYDWDTYDQALLKVVVTLNGETFESNQIQIDSWAWAGLVVMNETEGDVVFDPDNGFLICDGASIINTIQMPYSVVQWYKDGEAIDGATSVHFTITEPGTYHAVAAPEFCPNSTSTTLPIVVAMNPDCIAGINDPELANTVTLYPNPTNGILNIILPQNSILQDYSIFDISGKKLLNGKIDLSGTIINVESLSSGTYFVKLSGPQVQATKMLIINY